MTTARRLTSLSMLILVACGNKDGSGTSSQATTTSSATVAGAPPSTIASASVEKESGAWSLDDQTPTVLVKKPDWDKYGAAVN